MKPKEVKSKFVYSSPWLRVREDRFTQGGKERTFNVVERSDSVVIFPLTPTKRTVLLKHFRYPTQNYSLEAPMGGIDEGETVEQAARRELLEEINIDATNLEYVNRFKPVPALTNQQVDIFVARIDDALLDQANSEPNGDDIEGLSIVSIDDVYKKVSEGKITDGFTLSSLLFLKIYLGKQGQ